MSNLEKAQREWELSKYTDEELERELYNRKQSELSQFLSSDIKAELYSRKEDLDISEPGIIYDTNTGKSYNVEDL